MSSPQTRSPSPPFNNSTFILPSSIMSSHDHQFNNPNNKQHRTLSPQTISTLHYQQQQHHHQHHQQHQHPQSQAQSQQHPHYLHPQQLRSQPHKLSSSHSQEDKDISISSSIDDVLLTQEKIDKNLQIKDLDRTHNESKIEATEPHLANTTANLQDTTSQSSKFLNVKDTIIEEDVTDNTTINPQISITATTEDTSNTPPTSSSTSSSSCSLTRLKSCKRSSSSSNDLLYERDRFRARLKSFNDCIHCDKPNTTSGKKSDETLCDVCDGIGFKTAKLNMNQQHQHTNSVQEVPTTEEEEEEAEGDIFEFRHITIPQLKKIFSKYFNSTLPKTQDVFPWLHGLHNDNFAQKSFFLQQQQQLQQKLGINNNNFFIDFDLTKPRSSKFLMCVNDDSIPVQLHNSVKLNEILQKIDVSKSEIKNIIESIWDDEIIDHKFLDLLVNDCINLNVLPIFLNLDPDRGISLRNFHIQVAKLSTSSDFIIYGSNKEKMNSMARVLWLAQKYDQQLNTNEYQEKIIYILDDEVLENSKIYEKLELEKEDESLETPLKNYFNFSKINRQKLDYKIHDPFLVWENDFQINEKIETTKMSTATRINQNVWIGNFWDYQIMNHYLNTDKNLSKTTQESHKDLYNNPKNSLILHKNLKSRDFINLLPHPKTNYKLFLHCHSDATFPDLNELSKLLFQYTITSHENSTVQERHYLSFPPSGSIGIGDCKRENLNSIINTCKLIYLYSSSNSSNGLGSLIYCSDGYTESSLFVFCFMIYSLNISLDEAILQLHLKYGRPFYIFNSDVIILQKLEPLLRKFSPLKLGSKIEWSKLKELTAMEINEILLGKPKVQNNTRLGYIVNSSDEEEYEDEEESNQPSDLETSSSSDSDDNLSDIETEETELKKFQVDWVKEVEGSIPSKILPYLYLGSLKHASCLPLLNKLGIKKIISVGENLPWINGYKFQKYNNILVDEIENQNIEFFNIVPKSPKFKKSKLHWNTTIETIMKVNNLEDDGIDELSQQLPSILEFIEKEYTKTKGQTKILVHCRVGVSRSATVVIAEIMRRLQINLSMAYLYVRVRRLNIIIQPNLRFMYELFKWEESIKLETKNQFLKGNEDEEDNEHRVVNYNDGTIYLREIDWFIMCREIMRLNIPYLNN
ncbi:PPS1 [Candida jiufengensis]|uniref:PPS1 n=1 Tax=Candida jiufengensis TaxID=497108 RepID=UPI002224E663|nr:PPS1 [Candida jiufengensis]KAI5950463.1 PPS1 [Candida jiufengensis]